MAIVLVDATRDRKTLPWMVTWKRGIISVEDASRLLQICVHHFELWFRKEEARI